MRLDIEGSASLSIDQPAVLFRVLAQAYAGPKRPRRGSVPGARGPVFSECSPCRLRRQLLINMLKSGTAGRLDEYRQRRSNGAIVSLKSLAIM